MYTSIGLAAVFIVAVIAVVAYFLRRRPVETEIEEDPIVTDINGQLHSTKSGRADEELCRQLEVIARSEHEAVSAT